MSQTAEYELHPLAHQYRPLKGGDYEGLKESIRLTGQQVPAVVWRGQLVDGKNRLRACQDLGIRLWTMDRSDLPEEKLPALVKALNLDRRHLSIEERRTLAEHELKADPEVSDRQVAEKAGLDDKTVATVREDMEARSEIPHVETRKDRKGRKQPARKKRGRPPKDKSAPAEGRSSHGGKMVRLEAEPERPPPEPEPSVDPPDDEPVLFPDPPPESPPPAALGDPGPAQLKRSEHERVKELADDEEDEQLGLFLQSLMDRAARVERVRCARLAEQYAGRFLDAHMPLKALAQDILALG